MSVRLIDALAKLAAFGVMTIAIGKAWWLEHPTASRMRLVLLSTVLVVVAVYVSIEPVLT